MSSHYHHCWAELAEEFGAWSRTAYWSTGLSANPGLYWREARARWKGISPFLPIEETR